MRRPQSLLLRPSGKFSLSSHPSHEFLIFINFCLCRLVTRTEFSKARHPAAFRSVLLPILCSAFITFGLDPEHAFICHFCRHDLSHFSDATTFFVVCLYPCAYRQKQRDPAKISQPILPFRKLPLRQAMRGNGPHQLRGRCKMQKASCVALLKTADLPGLRRRHPPNPRRLQPLRHPATAAAPSVCTASTFGASTLSSLKRKATPPKCAGPPCGCR